MRRFDLLPRQWPLSQSGVLRAAGVHLSRACAFQWLQVLGVHVGLESSYVMSKSATDSERDRLDISSVNHLPSKQMDDLFTKEK